MEKFKNKGTNAVSKELQQLNDRDNFTSMEMFKLTTKQKDMALDYLMFLEDKSDNHIKGTTNADRSKQRG